MSTPSKAYRLYSYDGARRILTSDWIQAGSDEEAIASAREQGFGTKGEVWDGNRLVAQLDGERQTA